MMKILLTINPYSSTKLISEIILEDLTMHKNFSSILLRYFNPIGAHPSGLIGESPKNNFGSHSGWLEIHRKSKR